MRLPALVALACTELAEMSRGERAKEIQLCNDEFVEAKDFGEAGDGKDLSSKTRFLKIDGDWNVLFESR